VHNLCWHREVDYRDVEIDGAATAARHIAALLNCKRRTQHEIHFA
jgi:hypothetical protein